MKNNYKVFLALALLSSSAFGDDKPVRLSDRLKNVESQYDETLKENKKIRDLLASALLR